MSKDLVKKLYVASALLALVGLALSVLGPAACAAAAYKNTAQYQLLENLAIGSLVTGLVAAQFANAARRYYKRLYHKKFM